MNFEQNFLSVLHHIDNRPLCEGDKGWITVSMRR
jgi:hypothetical protein